MVLKQTILSGVTAVYFSLVSSSCGPTPVALDELITSPSEYKGKKLEIEGYVGNVEESRTSESVPLMDPHISFSGQVTLTDHIRTAKLYLTLGGRML